MLIRQHLSFRPAGATRRNRGSPSTGCDWPLIRTSTSVWHERPLGCGFAQPHFTLGFAKFTLGTKPVFPILPVNASAFFKKLVGSPLYLIVARHAKAPT
jgi:hypothetical protein